MPRDGSGVYDVPPGTEGTPNTTILSAAYNAFLADLVSDLNAARPITSGGTGGTSVITGWDGLATDGADIASASSINLTTATGPLIDITGTTAVSTVTLAEGAVRLARATGAFRLTAGASLVVNGSTSQSYTTTAGDLLLFRGYGSSVVRVWTINTPPYGLAPYPTGHLYGLTLSNNGSDATNDIDIAVGTARDGADSANIDLAAALTGKQLDTAWAVGSSAGLLATGAAVTNTTYYIFLIKRPDTGVVDAAADTSSSGANIAANTNAAYTIKRLIGIVVRSGGTNGTPFTFPPSATSSNYGRLIFPATQNPSSNANTLDDYEEGSWTPVDGSGVGLTITVTTARYVKIGKMVTCRFNVTYAGNANGTTAAISGLPFTAATDSAAVVGAGSAYCAAASPNGLLAIATFSNDTKITFINNSAGGQPTNATLGGLAITGTFSYEASA